MQSNSEQSVMTAEANDSRTASDKAVVCKELLDAWLPIQTAPMDGTRVLLWCGDEIEIGYWSTCTWARNVKPDGTLTDGAWIIYENRSDTIELSPTHWRPLPPKPKSSNDQAQRAPD